jgi:iron complex outermembrane receptor protein
MRCFEAFRVPTVLAAARAAVIAGGLLAIGSPAAAQSVPPVSLRDLSLEALGNLEVLSVTKQTTEIWHTPAAMSVITREDIRRSGARSIPQVLRLAPGVEVERIDASHWSIGIRGFGDQFSKSVLVLIDGRNTYSPLFAGTFWPAYDILLEDVERIEVIRGPGGTIWGGNAVNGVINIVTRHTADTRGTLALFGTGTDDPGTAAVRRGGGNGAGLDYRVYAKGFAIGPQYHPDGAEFDANGWMIQSGFRADWDQGAGQTLTIQGDLSKGQHGQRVRAATFSPATATTLDGLADTSGGNVMAVWRRRLDTGELRVQGYYDRIVWRAPHFAETRDTIDFDYVQSAHAHARHRLNWGAGLRWSPGAFTAVLQTLDFTPRRDTSRIYSAMVQDEIQLVPERLSMAVGTKLEHNSYTGLEIQPSVRMAWTPGPRQTVWSAVTRAVRIPSRIERAVASSSLATPVGPVFLQITGNPAFQAERLIGYEAGYRSLVGNLYVGFSGFHNEHRGLAGFGAGPITVAGAGANRYTVVQVPYVNGVDGTSTGFEFAPDWSATSAWRLKGSYAFRSIALHSTPVNIDTKAVSRYEGSTPQHLMRVQSSVDLPNGWEVDVAYRSATRTPARLVNGFHTADARLGWRVTDMLQLSIEGRNLLQPHHAEYSPFVQVRRSAYVKLTWERASVR